ncbi:MAG: hypothetical protein PHT07_21680 [Paludibacter sp.]|nr:hypothetical protein [Paludibacter sp.]
MKRYLKKTGDYRDVYVAGAKLVLKWNREWNITKVAYDKDKNVTTVRLER